ncbi:SDR family NAD(P)-dependent oxidoreductase, partial [Azospirillum sp. B4]|uniref:SDR family NAD(P)-dependent oxidoreductase n=1 Tax=Azospirillum sp. B4 TaxID=95605 RepID=UPI0035E3C0D1
MRERPVALVTGASAGTGSEIALALGAAGHDVAITGRRTEALEELAGQLRGQGADVLVLTVDVRDAAALDQALTDFLGWSGGRVDVVVNAAGTTGPLSPPIGEFSVADFDNVIATNLRAPFIVLSRLLPVMRAAKGGRIVNIGGNPQVHRHRPGIGEPLRGEVLDGGLQIFRRPVPLVRSHALHRIDGHGQRVAAFRQVHARRSQT